ncbi:16S rRNA (guanine(527)-N(7))-methyltransferase RsmG [Variovorax sp. PAMC 28711]|uniref:16S rRNA (guanine(527)-N(7))-methyltransferase RsmG n=1 Tax=Variovorax sp. PAMC 28711 TaxID=1795631 RepID=UPI00078D1FD5|nr:16S rRNA (guanine(527)-N(7))-methyltransferase RsmG [Variovorax sp. PAMC 28711]AMM24691.1 16S rRNA (guanine(527)-N(7))-methyltransferase RsmG [Variovorax sp. PAMC 28711]
MTLVVAPAAPTLKEGAAALGVALTDPQTEQLLAYGRLILKWNKVYNLTALRDPESVLTHHLLDSLAVVAPLQRELASRQRIEAKLLDVGSGAGLPGAVIAILCPTVDVTCVDAVAKKVAFVQQVAAELKLPNLRGLHIRIEALTGAYDVISSRAFASLADFVEVSAQVLADQGIWLAMKGRAPDDELSLLPPIAKMFHVEHLTVPGLDAERCIVWMRKAAG